MANNEHLAILKQGVEAWNKWRTENPDIVPDLIGANLQNTNLSGANLSGADLVFSKLSGASLSRANLSRASLLGASLERADLSYADLSYAELNGADLCFADLKKSKLNYATFNATKFLSADLEGADLSNADLWCAELNGANLNGANLTGAKLRSIILDKPIRKESSSDSTITSFERSLQSQMETMRKGLEEKIEQVKNPLNNEEFKQEVNKTISEKIDKIISEDIVQYVGKKSLELSEDLSIKTDISGFIIEKYDKSSGRYGGYGEDSKKEALLYRNWGIRFCIAGIVVAITVLGFILIGQFPNYENWTKIFIGLPVTLTLEGIGLLLLTLSQKATERMRSFSIEQCNLDIQSAGDLSLVKSGDLKEITTAMEGLAKSERRHILKKDERTIEDSHNKSHLDFMKSVMDSIKPVLNNKS